ncbi:MAG: TrbI F-type domain-containing protein [Betaproteobacteria bacterium]|nr:TrbI F-type domain-containing protein [Betaproteobacteria bacterium]
MKLMLSRKEILSAVAAAGVLAWGSWVTISLARPHENIVRLGAAGLVQEYSIAVAHSNWSVDQIKTQTVAFTTELDKIVSEQAAQGRTVLMNEAVLSHTTPDITAEVRTELMKRVAWPAPGTAPAVAQPLPPGSIPVPGQQ